ncbi:MAG TPA: HipA domain-containing protein [Fibrobacteria bacterium]|nr:HipA domain-containing protein [Fibrobacteria bacterium]
MGRSTRAGRLNVWMNGEKDVAALLRNAHVSPLAGLPDSGEFRISLAGFQSKTALLLHKGRWHLPKGSTPTTHILKLPMGDKVGVVQADLSASVENEWLCNRVLDSFGMSVAHCEMARFEDQRVLVVERFDRRLAEDRSWWIRLPQEDMCQALETPLGLKYESEGAPGMKDILELLLGSRDSAIDRRTFLKAQVLFWMLCAIDGHARNFSVFIGRGGRGGRCRLTPLYDVISAYPILGHDRNQLAPEKARMAMSVRGRGRQYLWDRITRKYWLETAKAVGMGGEIGGILEEAIEGTPQALEKAGNSLPKGFPGRVEEAIFKGIRKAVKRLAVAD